MSDDTFRAPPLADYRASDLDRLTSGERQTFNDILSKVGFKETLPYTTEPKFKPPAALPEVAGQANVAEKYSITAKEATAGAAMLRRFASPEILAALDKLEIGDPAIEPTRAEQSAQNIQDSYRPGATASEYTLKFPEGIEAAELVKLNNEITSAFIAAQVPIVHAQPFADAMAKSAEAVVNMNENQRTLHNREVFYHAQKLVGQEGMERAARTAKSLGVSYTKWLNNGTFASVEAIVLLNQIGQAVEYRALRAKEKAPNK
jgi:hypothetical protein